MTMTRSRDTVTFTVMIMSNISEDHEFLFAGLR